MRVGSNPHKNQPIKASEFIHQIVIPVYIPNFEGYFKDGLNILKLCLESVFNTTHSRTFITVVNNGSCQEVKSYLDQLFNKNYIHEVIHTQNIGKLNAILKGIAGNKIELVTISDADVLFLKHWQTETSNIFRVIPKVGVVGLVPQFKNYETNSGSLIFDNFFNKKLKFYRVQNPDAMVCFYESIGWDKNYNHDYLKYALGLEFNETKVIVGSGHFVATYKKQALQEIKTYLNYKLGGDSESYLDSLPLKYGYWRVTTFDNFAYHLGNTFEDWMTDNVPKKERNFESEFHFSTFNKENRVLYFIKNRIFIKIMSFKFTYKLFLKFKKLPKAMIAKY
jgi:hypothetical protein